MGVWEIVLIALVVLIVAGPKRLPEIMRTVGSWAGQARNLARGLQQELDNEGEQLKRQVTPPEEKQSHTGSAQDKPKQQATDDASSNQETSEKDS